MVYCGKPSKGCQECRDRKTRCDRVTPSCNQCIRAKRQCPGYRDQLDLMFRNESEHVVGKAKAKEKAKQKTKSPVSQKTQSESPSKTLTILPPKEKPTPQPKTLPISPPASLPETSSKPLEEYTQTSNHFFVPPGAESSISFINDNVYHGQFAQALLSTASIFPTMEECALSTFTTNSTSWFRSWGIQETTATPTYSDEYLLASMSAVGLASFSTTMHAPELMTRARKDYVTALQLTNAALRSPKDVRKDSTLFAVMILSIFETVSGNTERSLAAWAEHVNGAAALIKLRGPAQFSTTAGSRMFLQVCGNLMLSCIQRGTAMPDFIIELRKEAEFFMDASNPAWRMSGIVIDFANLRSAVREGRIKGPRAVINAASDLEDRFTGWITSLPPDWRWETHYSTEHPELIWNNMYHIYKVQWIAHVWNSMRTSRILLHEMIRDQLLANAMALTPIFTNEESDMRFHDSVAVMLEMRTDILATVPQHTPSILNNANSNLVEGSRSYFMLWPLYLAGSMDLSTVEIRDWTVQRLRDIGEMVGLKQAIVLADLMMTREHIPSFDAKPVLAPQVQHFPMAQIDLNRPHGSLVEL